MQLTIYNRQWFVFFWIAVAQIRLFNIPKHTNNFWLLKPDAKLGFFPKKKEYM